MSENREKIVIKRYRNRKLYDTRHSEYVTLDDISEMIRDHKDIQVLENDSGEDITSATLAQILFEGEKKAKGFLTLGELNRIIRERSQKVRSFVEKSLPSDHFQMDDGILHGFYDEIESQINRIFRKDSAPREEQEKLIRRIFSTPQHNLEELFENIEEKFQEGFNKLTHLDDLKEDYASLNRRLRALEREMRKRRREASNDSDDVEAGEEGAQEAANDEAAVS